MISRFFSEIHARFDPFSPASRSARLFLSILPARIGESGTVVRTRVLPRNSAEPAELKVKFTDGRQMVFQSGRHPIRYLVEEVDRHSRSLVKIESISDK